MARPTSRDPHEKVSQLVFLAAPNDCRRAPRHDGHRMHMTSPPPLRAAAFLLPVRRHGTPPGDDVDRDRDLGERDEPGQPVEGESLGQRRVE